MKRLLGLAALSAVLACGTAHAQVTVKIGVLSDMSSLYSDIGGPGSVAAAKMAIADFTKAHPLWNGWESLTRPQLFSNNVRKCIQPRAIAGVRRWL